MYTVIYIQIYLNTTSDPIFLISLWVVAISSKMMVMMTWSTSSHQKFDMREKLSTNFDCVWVSSISVINTESTCPLCGPALCWLGTRPAHQAQQLNLRVVVETGLCGDNSLWFQESHLSISFSCYQTLACGILKPSWISVALVLTPFLPGTFSKSVAQYKSPHHSIITVCPGDWLVKGKITSNQAIYTSYLWKMRFIALLSQVT